MMFKLTSLTLLSKLASKTFLTSPFIINGSGQAGSFGEHLNDIVTTKIRSVHIHVLCTCFHNITIKFIHKYYLAGYEASFHIPLGYYLLSIDANDLVTYANFTSDFWIDAYYRQTTGKM